MRTFITTSTAVIAAAFMPALAFAQTTITPQQGLFGLVSFANSLLNAVVVLLISLAVVMIFWYSVQTIRTAGDPKARKESINGLIYSVAALAVMVSIWGLVRFLQATLGVNNSAAAQAPSVLNIQ